MFKRLMIPAVVSFLFVGSATAAEPETAEFRIKSVQRAAVASSPALQARLHEAAMLEQEARSDAAAINPYVEWQSEGLGSGTKPNAQDTLRIGTPFNFFGQMGPARDLAQTAGQGGVVLKSAAARSISFEATNRWLDLAAAVERLEIRKARLEKLDTALSFLEARHQLGEVAGTEVAQLDLEHTGAASMVASSNAEVEMLRQSVEELCGPSFAEPRPGDLAALAAASRSPEPDEIHGQALAAGVPMLIADTEAGVEVARARMAAAAAWGRPMAEVEWERFPNTDAMPGYDAWGFRVAFPLPLGSAGARNKAAAREREAAAAASRLAVSRETSAQAEAALARATGAEIRLETIASSLAALPQIEESLSAQFRLGVLTYVEFVFGTVRHDELRMMAVDVYADLLSARLHLNYLLDDPSVFPTAEISTEEDS